jgi:hypothetical protein
MGDEAVTLDGLKRLTCVDKDLVDEVAGVGVTG